MIKESLKDVITCKQHGGYICNDNMHSHTNTQAETQTRLDKWIDACKADLDGLEARHEKNLQVGVRVCNERVCAHVTPNQSFICEANVYICL